MTNDIYGLSSAFDALDTGSQGVIFTAPGCLGLLVHKMFTAEGEQYALREIRYAGIFQTGSGMYFSTRGQAYQGLLHYIQKYMNSASLLNKDHPQYDKMLDSLEVKQKILNPIEFVGKFPHLIHTLI